MVKERDRGTTPIPALTRLMHSREKTVEQTSLSVHQGQRAKPDLRRRSHVATGMSDLPKFKCLMNWAATFRTYSRVNLKVYTPVRPEEYV